MPRYLCVFLPGLPCAPEPHEPERIDALADWSRRFTPLAATDGLDGLVLDVAGAAHLIGGEAALLALVERKFSRHGARDDLWYRSNGRRNVRRDAHSPSTLASRTRWPKSARALRKPSETRATRGSRHLALTDDRISARKRRCASD